MSDEPFPLAEAFCHLATTKPVFGHAGERLADPTAVHRAFRETFGTEQGQKVLTWIMQEGGFFRSEASQTNETAREMIGQRKLALTILSLYAAPPPPPKPIPRTTSPLERT